METTASNEKITDWDFAKKVNPAFTLASRVEQVAISAGHMKKSHPNLYSRVTLLMDKYEIPRGYRTVTREVAMRCIELVSRQGWLFTTESVVRNAASRAIKELGYQNSFE